MNKFGNFEQPTPVNELQSFDTEKTSETREADYEKFQQEIAAELKKPHNGSYFEKLKRIMGAFVLAGIMTLAVPQEGVAPEVSKERIALDAISLSSKEGDEARKMIRKALAEKGGVEVSPQLSEMAYKPRALADMAQAMAIGEERPYFLKPELVLGKDFVKKNAEQAEEYMDKIKKTIMATVLIKSKTSQASGFVVDTDKESVIVTNAHVAGNNKELFIEYCDGEMAYAQVVVVNEGKDLAILRITNRFAGGEQQEKNENSKKTRKGMRLASDEEFENLKYREKIAIVGNPIGYPFEAAIVEFEYSEQSEGSTEENTENTAEGGKKIWGDKAISIFSTADSRFDTLALYDKEYDLEHKQKGIRSKGVSKSGMSGGPMIILNKKGDPKLIGVNAFSGEAETYLSRNKIGLTVPTFDKNKIHFSGGTSVKDLREFLLKNGYNPDRATS